jgi:hypothetical protein
MLSVAVVSLIVVGGQLVGIASRADAISIVTSPNVTGATENGLEGVACVSASNCTAAGHYDLTGGVERTLIEHWNGTAWSIVASPNPGATQSAFNGVACSGASDCEAVGEYESTSSENTLVEHWNGVSWSPVASPNAPGSSFSQLFGVACAGAASCEAVGDYYTSSGDERTLVERWNGTAWSIVPSPNVTGAHLDELDGVACTGSTSCEAVGYELTGSVTKVLAERWNGTAWSLVSTGALTAVFADLHSVSCTSASNCMAAGTFFPTQGVSKTLVEHWNGSTWTVVPSPNPPSNATFLEGVACGGPWNCEAVGDYVSGTFDVTLAERWNGAAWSIVTTPNPSGAALSNLVAVACPALADCEAVGHFNTSGGRTLVERDDPIVAQQSFNCRIQSHANTKFVNVGYTLTGALYGILRAAANSPGPAELLRCVALGSNRWAIQSRANGKYASAELLYTGALQGALRARASTPLSWETYSLSPVASCACYALKAANGKYVSAELAYTGATYGLLRARAASVGAWEQFDISPG